MSCRRRWPPPTTPSASEVTTLRRYTNLFIIIIIIIIDEGSPYDKLFSIFLWHKTVSPPIVETTVSLYKIVKCVGLPTAAIVLKYAEQA